MAIILARRFVIGTAPAAPAERVQLAICIIFALTPVVIIAAWRTLKTRLSPLPSDRRLGRFVGKAQWSSA